MKITKDTLTEYAQYLIGAEFSSKKFGIGKCVSVGKNRINIDFGGKYGIKPISFPYSILQNLITFVDEEGTKEQIEALRNIKRIEKICAQINEREIKNFVHFTRVSNLKSILEHGLCSIDYMKNNGISYIENDKQRLDGRTDAISLSITFPNYKNFYKLYQNQIEQWCFILLDPQRVVSLDCAFFWTNAANSLFRGLEWEEFRDYTAFSRMFEGNKRSSIIPDSYTTDPQAEIMVKNEIPVEYITGIVFDRKPNINIDFPCRIMIDYTFFSPRVDYKEWSRCSY